MKIIFLNIYQGWVDRGAETFVAELSKRLKENNDVKVVGGDKRISAKKWPFLWRIFLDPRGIRICLFTIKKLPLLWREKADIVIPLNGGWQAAMVRIITWLYGGKMIVSGQSGVGWDDRNNLWSFPDVFVALSGRAKIWAKKANPFVKVKYIPNGVDTDKFCSGGKTIRTKLKKPIILCVAALTKTKRIDLVIKTVAKIEEASLLIVGKGEEEGKLQALGTRLLGNRFQITSYPYEKMSEVYRVADIFTLVSEPYYSFEIVLAEAMASGLSVVATNDAIRKEIVGDAGILVDPTNTEAYANVIKEALGKKWGDKPRKQAEKFSWDKIAKKYEKLFSVLLY